VHDRLDYLINNAAIVDDARTSDLTDLAWDSVIGTCLTGVFNMTRAALPHMVSARFGRIVNISSVAGRKGSERQSNYAAAKAGVHGLTWSVARETAGLGVTVNCVAPGPIETELSASTDPELLRRIKNAVPMKRMGSPAEVAFMVEALLDDLAGFITGAVIPVDGGLGM
jgi:NAD(P)-dependent dehydrogenase (short-subunit alcohol dehydrogenase family)